MSLKIIWFSLLLFLNLKQCSSAECSITYNINEEVPNNTLVGDLSKHLSENEKGFKFEFSRGKNEYKHLFRIETASGRLLTVERIDREEWCEAEIECNLELNLLKFRPTGDRLDGMCQLKIVVIDINDNAPIFESNTTSQEIDESWNVNSVINIKGAYDRDSGNNAVKSYELLNGKDKFDLKTDNNGLLIGLVLKSQLDHEEKDFYNLTLIAKDDGIPQKHGSLIINLKVKDINDNKPQFTKESYNVNVDENASISSAILTLSATDADSGQNGEVGYKFYYNVKQSVKKIFSINEASGEIILKKNIDFERKKKYSFSVVGFDNGSPSQSSIVSVNIHVLNINDNKPDIVVHHISENVSESDKIGDTIAHIEVSDGDGDTVACSLSNSYFKLDPNLQCIMIDKQLDFEKIPIHNISILCHDNGEPELQNHKSFQLRVHDANDNAPVFKNPIIVEQLENNDFQAFKIEAEDMDSGMNSVIYYKLLNDSVSSLFNISDQLITTDVQFDREENPKLEFKVLAIDRGKPPLTGTGTVILHILDVNDEEPTFGKDHYEFHVKEGQAPSTFIEKVEAHDLDIKENGQLDYWIPSDNSSEYFKIDQGNLKTKRTLTWSKNLRYDFTVFVSDRGTPPLSTFTSVTVFVDDINDNAPYFVFPMPNNNSISIVYEMTATNKPIATIIALDDDDGENAKLSYFLKESPESSDLFQINNSSGEIMLVKNTIEVQIERIKLTIIVRDHGEPNRENTSILFVKMVNFGNSAVDPNTDEYIDETNSRIGLVLGIVTACLIVCVIVVICIVRRIDNNRRQYPPRKLEDVAMKKSLNRTQCSQVSLHIQKTSETTGDSSLRIRERMESDDSVFAEEEIDESLNNNTTEKQSDSLSRISSVQGGSCAALL